MLLVFFVKHKTAYEMRISDWSSDVCSSDLMLALARRLPEAFRDQQARRWGAGMPRLLGASVVLIIGVGAIGEAVGAKCAAFGARVIGISERTDRPAGFSDMYPKVA